MTQADLNYEGSITIPPELLSEAQMAPFEEVSVWNVTNGERFNTYTIRGESHSGDICVNSAAARLVQPGDVLIIACYNYYSPEEIASHEPKVVFVNSHNQSIGISKEIAGPRLRKV